MEGTNWKRVLLHWVNQTKFFTRTFYKLEQTDVEEFFEKFSERLTNCPVKQVDQDLIEFLRIQYPEFEPHLDDDNHLSDADFMYVYSLLLHFSCVKYPQEYFHLICRSLRDQFQQAIATFFQSLLEKDVLNKTILRQAIADASLKAVLDVSQVDSPVKTPAFKLLPPTPRTTLLEEKTRELNLTKAQLETERYEKGLLEVQLKQNEEKIKKLCQTQKNYVTEIQDLRNELLTKSTVNESPTKNIMDEQIKKRLRKDIAEKEEIILELRENFESLKEEKIFLAEKLSYTEKEIIGYLNKIKEMDYEMNDLKAEIEKKDLTIKVLTETKNDLEQFIEETRTNGRSDLNMSGESLDISLSRTTNSSGSLNSPENLGCSVIDIQLKEKQNENLKLREEINNLRCDESKLSKRLMDLIKRYADVFEICKDNLIVNEEAALTEVFLIFDNYITNLVEKYKYSLESIKEMELNLEHLQRDTKMKISSLESEHVNLVAEISRLKNELALKEENDAILKDKYKSLEKDYKKMEKIFQEVSNNLEKLQDECKIKNSKIDQLNEHVSAIMNENSGLHIEINDLTTRNTVLEELDRKYRNQVSALEADISRKDDEIITIIKELQKLQSESQLGSLEHEKEKTKQDLLIKQLNQNIENSANQITNFSKLCNDLNESLNKLKEENKTLSKRIAHKDKESQQFSDLISELQSEKHSVEQMKINLQEKLTTFTENEELIKNELNILLEKLQENFNEESEKYDLVNYFNEEFSDSIMNDLKNKLNIILNNNNECNKKNTELQNVISNLETRLDDVSQTKDTLIQKLTKSENTIEQLEKECRNLEQSKSDYLNQVEIFKNHVNQIESQCSCLSEANIELRTVSNVLEQELQSINQDNMSLLCKIGDLEVDNQHLSEKCEKLYEQLQLTQDEMEKLKISAESTLKSFEHDIILLEEDKRNVEEKVTSLQEHYEENQKLITELEFEKGELAEQIEANMSALQEKDIYISCLENETDDLKQKIKEINADLLDKENKFKKQLHEYNAKTHQLKEELKHFKELKDDLKDRFKKNESTLQLANDEVSKYKTRMEELIIKTLQQEEQYKILLDQFENKTIEKDDIEKKYASIQANVTKINENNVKDKDKLRQYEKEISNLKEQLLKINNEIKILNADKNNLSNKNHALNQELNSLSEKYKNNENEIITLQSTNKCFLEQIQSLKQSIERLQEELSQQKRISDNLQQEVQTLNSRNETLRENNVKLEETSNNYEKRVEQISIKLGDSMAKVSKLERERDSIKNDFESLKLSEEKLQNEIKKLQNSNQVLKDKQINLQKTCDQLSSGKKILEENNTQLERQTKTLKDSENTLKVNINQLEQDKKELEAKLQRLSITLSEMNEAIENAKEENINLEKKNVIFTSEILDLKKSLDAYKQTDTKYNELEVKYQKISENLNHTQKDNEHIREVNEQMKKELNKFHKENLTLSGELSNITDKYMQLQEEHEHLRDQLSSANDIISKLRKEIEALEKENISNSDEFKQKIQAFEVERSSKIDSDERIKELEDLLKRKSDHVEELLEQVEHLKSKGEDWVKEFSKKSKIFDELKEKLETTEVRNKEERNLNDALKRDIDILKAKLYKNREITEEKEKKWLEEKSKLMLEIEKSEDRIKENRLELEGKLEKMKMKMKAIYNEEVSKIKNKHEKEIGEIKKEIHMLTIKNEKYENHVTKLSRQIYQLNETILELQKENKFMETKIKDYESCSTLLRNKHNLPTTSSQVLGTDLRMEDEQGEFFNNTYLTDLKTGRMSPFGRESVSAQELQYRNSLAPPHLRSTYCAQYLDQHLREDDIKDGIPANLDDSLSSLLYSGQRKKLSGTTSYKKPGPPTPSKNAGRLSFGGCGDTHPIPREILKESNDCGMILPKKSTPNKLKTFFSSSRSKDEFLSPSDRRYSLRRKRISRPLGAQFTSTPRKSKEHFDQRRQLDLLLSTSSNSDTTVDERKCRKRILSTKHSAEKELEAEPKNQIVPYNWRESKETYETESTESNSSTVKKNKGNPKNKGPARKERRVSFFYRGNVYARSKVPSIMIREQLKNKAKNERYNTFNRLRKSLNGVHLRKSLLFSNRISTTSENNQNSCDIVVGKELDSYNNCISENNYNFSEKFELLLKEKESRAPFEVTDLNLVSSSSGSVSTATSKTLYAGSIIYNRTIPRINSTTVRKTSIYVVNRKDGKSIIKLAHDKINFIDLCRLWWQISRSTKLIVCFIILVPFILSLLIMNNF